MKTFREYLAEAKVEKEMINESTEYYLIASGEKFKTSKVLNFNIPVIPASLVDIDYMKTYKGNKISIEGGYAKIPVIIDESGMDFKCKYIKHPAREYGDKYAVIEIEDMIKLIKKHFKNFTPRTETSWETTKEFVDECMSFQKKTEQSIINKYATQFQILENIYEFALFFPNLPKEKEDIKKISLNLITAETKTVLEGEGKLSIEQFNRISGLIKKLKNGSYLEKI